MKYTADEVLQFVNEEDIKFIRLAFTDVFGIQKNISILPYKLKEAFSLGIQIEEKTFLYPDPTTFALLPWRPDHGRVARMYCAITSEDGTPLNSDIRSVLKDTSAKDTRMFTTECEFYLFKLDENGNPTNIPYDFAGYLDIAPLDKCENIRREICLTLEAMEITPYTSCHGAGYGQNKISFASMGALNAADNLSTYMTIVRTMAASNGLFADFSEQPLTSGPKVSCNIIYDKKTIDLSPLDNPYKSHLDKLF